MGEALTKAQTILHEYERDTKGEIALVWRLEAGLREAEERGRQQGLKEAAAMLWDDLPEMERKRLLRKDKREAVLRREVRDEIERKAGE